MTVQTTYETGHDQAYEGQQGDASNRQDIKSRTVEETLGIAPGLAVVFAGAGVAGQHSKIKLPTAAGDLLEGITIRSLEHQVDATQTIKYDDERSAPVLESGTVWVKVLQAVAINDPVFYRHTGGDEGTFRMDADTADAKAIDSAYFLTAAGIGELALAFLPYHVQ